MSSHELSFTEFHGIGIIGIGIDLTWNEYSLQIPQQGQFY